MTNDHSIFAKLKESSLSISLTAALILVASIVVIISSITIQSAYMWLAVGATAVLFLGFCSCTTCEKTSHFHFRRGSIHSDSVSTISDGRDNFYEVTHPQNNPEYWIADLPPSYAIATAMTVSPENQLPPPYSAVVEVHGNTRNCATEESKPCEQSDRNYIDGQSTETAIVINDSNTTGNAVVTVSSVMIDSSNRTASSVSDSCMTNNASVC